MAGCTRLSGGIGIFFASCYFMKIDFKEKQKKTLHILSLSCGFWPSSETQGRQLGGAGERRDVFCAICFLPPQLSAPGYPRMEFD